jgi:thiol-disulfide isomerase/thioredoxin
MELPSFMSYIEDYRNKALEILNKQQLDPAFKETQIDFIEYCIKYYAGNYIRRYGIDPAKEKEYFLAAKKLSLESITSPSQIMGKLTPYLEAMRTKRLSREDRNSLDSLIWTSFDINNDKLYTYSSNYREMVSQRLNMLSQAERVKSPYKGRTQADSEDLKMDVINKEITSSLIKEHLLFVSAMVGLTSAENVDDFYNKYRNRAKDSVYIKQISTIYNRKQLTKPGEPSPSFSFADVNGKQVDLESLRGNYLYIDIWASWCVPCLKEIPSLLELEKKYHGKPIKFVSISVDKQSDKSKWLNSLKSHKLKGIQLLADKDFKSDFIKAYGIHAIPRFIIIDPEGKIVSPNASRPSNPKTASMLNDLLNKI